jgi:hypothetical protein
MSENKRVTIPFLEKVLKPIVDLVKTKADKKDILQSDWIQADETKIDFIKNKPIEETEDDALEMLTEMGILDPIQDEENNILTDEDGNIFTIE